MMREQTFAELFRRYLIAKCKDKYPANLDLIVCRNVLIYFTDEAKTDIYRKFNDSLKSEGFLFVGSTEQIINYRDLNYQSFRSFFYKKN